MTLHTSHAPERAEARSATCAIVIAASDKKVRVSFAKHKACHSASVA
jgi:hypothetical protein